MLQYPDFVEFDELNKKIVTRHAREDCFRVWSSHSYQLEYVIDEPGVEEFKICNGIMLLIFGSNYLASEGMKFRVINVHTGKTLHELNYSNFDGHLEFLEQFNENLLI